MAAPEAKKLKNKAKASLALLLVAVISITTATYAWFTLSNSTTVQNMTVEVGTGTVLKTYAGTTTSVKADDYFSVIKTTGTGATGELITHGLRGVDELAKVKFWPVTTGNGRVFYTHVNNGVAGGAATGPERGYYLDFQLTFFSDTDMNVYLNGENTPGTTAGNEDGTFVTSRDTSLGNANTQVQAEDAVRISFSDGNKTLIYEPIKTATAVAVGGNAAVDGGGSFTGTFAPDTFTHLGNNAGQKKGAPDETPTLFTLTADTPKTIDIRIWIEGYDPECTNDDANINIEQAKLLFRFRFCGADNNGNFIDVST